MLILVFIWLGSVFPDKYISTLKNCSQAIDVSCTLLGEHHWKIYYQRYKLQLNMSQQLLNSQPTVIRSDILRYLYLHAHGGLYSDLDNVIDYECLKQILKGQTNFTFGEEQWEFLPRKANQAPSNYFIYAPKAHEQILNQIITNLWKRTHQRVVDFTGPDMLTKFKYPFIQVHKCVRHLYDFNWKPAKPDQSKSEVKSDKSQQGVKPDKSKQGVKPNQSQQGVKPDKSQQGVKPDQSKSEVKSDKSQQKVKPNQSQSGVKPNQSQQGVKPNQSQSGVLILILLCFGVCLFFCGLYKYWRLNQNKQDPRCQAEKSAKNFDTVIQEIVIQ